MKTHTTIPIILSAAVPATFAASTTQLKPTADTFLSSAAPSSNYGNQGTLVVAGDSSVRGTVPTGRFESVLKFDVGAAVSQFDGEYGAGNWSISAVTLTFASNVGTQGGLPNSTSFPSINSGLFSILWMQDDSWSETGITYNNLGNYTAVTSGLGSWTYVPPGDNVPVTWDLGSNAPLLADVTAGGSVSFLVSPGDDTVAYLFNSRTYNSAVNQPVLTVSAIPEVSSLPLLLPALMGSLFIHRRS